MSYGEVFCSSMGEWEHPGYCAPMTEGFGPCPPIGEYCYCNCYCFGDGTNITMGDSSQVAVENVKKLDTLMVLSGDKVAQAGTAPKWTTAKVQEVGGTQLNSTAVVVRVTFGDQGIIMVSPTQLFLVYDNVFNNNTLINAEQLQIARHMLLDKAFNQVPITSLVLGLRHTGLHSLFTDAQVTTIPAHLLIAQGVVVGDFYLQHMYNVSNITQHDPALQLTVGNPDYELLYGPSFVAGDYDAFLVSTHPHDTLFTPWTSLGSEGAPYNANPLIPRWMEAGNHFVGMLLPKTDRIAYKNALDVIALWEVARPQINFTLLWESDIVNAFAWVDAQNNSRVVVHGGLVRHKLVGWQGLATILARAVALLTPLSASWTASKKLPGVSCARYADFAVALELAAWCSEDEDSLVPYSLTFTPDGINKVAAFLASLPYRTAIPQKCALSLGGVDFQCRNETMWAGLYGQPIPGCWDKPYVHKPAAQAAQAHMCMNDKCE